MLTKDQYSEMESAIKMHLNIDGNDVFVTDVDIVQGKVKIKFFCKDPELEESLTPHVHECIKKLIEEQECTQSNRPSSPIWSRIKNILRGCFRT